MAAIRKNNPVHSGLDLDFKVIIAVIDVFWGDRINVTLWSLKIKIMDFAGA